MAWFRSPAYHEFDAPIGDGAIGLTRKVQFGFSVPYYHVNAPGGPVVRGIGDLYLTSKVQLREPSVSHGVTRPLMYACGETSGLTSSWPSIFT